MANGNFGGGTGTAADPYLVEDAYDLDEIRRIPSSSYRYFKQIRNIDLSGINWIPVRIPHQYDGNFCSINNLTINVTDYDYISGSYGLFETSSSVYNLYVNNASINILGNVSSVIVGIITGYKYGGSIKNCQVHGSININDVHDQGNGCDIYVGGISAWSYAGSIENCISNVEINVTGDVSGYIVPNGYKTSSSVHLGGILANSSILVSNCYATGIITNDFIPYIPENNIINSIKIGGICGRARWIEGCFSLLDYISSNYHENFTDFDVGDVYGDISETQDRECYTVDTLTISSPHGVNSSGTIITQLEAKRKNTYINAGWDFNNIWGIDEGESYPYFLWSKPKPVKMKSISFKDLKKYRMKVIS